MLSRRVLAGTALSLLGTARTALGWPPSSNEELELARRFQTRRYRIRLWFRFKWARWRGHPLAVEKPPMRMPLLEIRIAWPHYKRLQRRVQNLETQMWLVAGCLDKQGRDDLLRKLSG